MKQKTRSEFTSRPEPPILIQIAEDIFKADEDDPIFEVLKRSRSDSEANNKCLDKASECVKKIKQLENLDFLRNVSKELQELSSQLNGTIEFNDEAKEDHLIKSQELKQNGASPLTIEDV